MQNDGDIGTQIGVAKDSENKDIESDNDSKVDPSTFLSSEDLKGKDLSNLKLVMFIACTTAASETETNLVEVAKVCGAETVIGFDETILCDVANEWTEAFWVYMTNGYNVKYACYFATADVDSDFNGFADKHEREAEANVDFELKPHGLDSYVICGNRGLTITQ